MKSSISNISASLDALPPFVRALLIAVFLALFVIRPVMAGCGGPPMDPDYYFQSADAVFVGKTTSVVSAWELPNYAALISGKAIVLNQPRTWHYATEIVPVRYTSFTVKDSWKDVTTTSVVVKTFPCIGIVTFQVGDEYLVYANKQDGHYVINAGSGTTITKNAFQDLSYLAALPKLTLTSSLPARGSNNITIPIGIVSLLIVLAGTWHLCRKQHSVPKCDV